MMETERFGMALCRRVDSGEQNFVGAARRMEPGNVRARVRLGEMAQHRDQRRRTGPARHEGERLARPTSQGKATLRFAGLQLGSGPHRPVQPWRHAAARVRLDGDLDGSVEFRRRQRENVRYRVSPSTAKANVMACPAS